MTRRQLRLHYDCALRRERRLRRQLVVDSGFGFVGGEKAEAHIKSLQG